MDWSSLCVRYCTERHEQVPVASLEELTKSFESDTAHNDGSIAGSMLALSLR